MKTFEPAGRGEYGVHSAEGVEFFETKELACEEAERLIEECKADGGWTDDVQSIYVFEVIAEAKPKDMVERPPQEELDDENFDEEGIDWSDGGLYIADWVLTDVVKPDTATTTEIAKDRMN